jgi:hypothetical protein
LNHLFGVVNLGFAVRNYRRQVNAQIFFEIAGRYHGMLQAFPVREWTTRFSPEGKLPEPSTELTSGVLRYLAIVHFAFILRELHYLSKDLWTILQAEHHRTLAAPLFVREWPSLRAEFALFPKFLSYVDSIQQMSGDSVTEVGLIYTKVWRSFKRTRP